MTTEERWPDDIRLKMVEKSELYENPTVYQYGYYDGYQLQNERIEKLLQELENVNEKFDSYVCYTETKQEGIYREYMDTIIPPIILVRK